MDSESTLDNVCRTCLTSGLFEMCSLLENSYFNDNLGNILYQCCAIEPDVNGMPSIICTECKNLLLSFYKFRKQCEDSDAVLRTYVKDNISAVFLPDSSSDCNDNDFAEELEFIDIKQDPIEPDIIEIIEDKFECTKNEIKLENTHKKVRATHKIVCKACNLQKCKCNKKSLAIVKIPEGITIKPVSKLKETKSIRKGKQIINKSGNIEEVSAVKLIEKTEKLLVDSAEITNKATETIEEHETDILHPVKQQSKRTFHQCPICLEHFPKKTHLEEHVLKHDSALPFTCRQCGKCFPKYRNLLLHEKVHTGERPYKCTTCDKSFALSGNLKTHIRIHTGYKPYSCKHCGKTFAQWSSLRSHLVCHSGDRSFICAVCGKSFTRAGILARHMTSHSDEKKYSCNICNKRFKNTSQRSRHMVTHTDIKKYKCSYCGKCFNRANNLKVHEMIHSGNRPHSCPVCGKGFIQLHCLRSHMNTHC